MRETTNTNGPRGRRSVGFTLVEVMVALGILALALPMVAAALLSGMLENQESVENTMSTLLAENAVALLRMRARDSDFPGNWGVKAGPLSFPDNRVPATVLHDDDCVYNPFPEDNKPLPFAFVILGKRLAENRNDYRFVVMVYRKFRETDTLSKARVAFKADKTIDDNKSSTYVRLSDQGTGQTALMSCYVVRMSLRS